MHGVFLAMLLLAAPQEESRETFPSAGEEPHGAPLIHLSGEIDLHYLHRGEAVNETGALLEALPADDASTNAWAGRASLRIDAEVGGNVSGVIELENRDFDEGINRFLGSDPERDGVDLKQAHINAFDLLTPGLRLRLGVQDVSFRNRPHDEPFFIDLGEVEGFYAGFSPAGEHLRNSVDRDVQEATGIRLSYDLAEVLTAQAVGVVYTEGGPGAEDEAVWLAVLNGTPSEKLSAWILGAYVTGPGSGLGDVWTLGAGVDTYFGSARSLELFAEGYLQGGELVEEPERVRKRSFAANVGGRVVGLLSGLLWLEAAFSCRSGNEETGDDADEAFQSYENENRFLILQSAEFGLDVDTNLRVVRGTAGLGPFTLAGRPLRFQLDVGSFRADEEIRDAGGAALGERDWGIETDLMVSWECSASLRLWAKGARLSSSDVLGALTREAEDEAFLAVAGAKLTF